VTKFEALGFVFAISNRVFSWAPERDMASCMDCGDNRETVEMGERELTHTVENVGDCSIHCYSDTATCNA